GEKRRVDGEAFQGSRGRRYPNDRVHAHHPQLDPRQIQSRRPASLQRCRRMREVSQGIRVRGLRRPLRAARPGNTGLIGVDMGQGLNWKLDQLKSELSSHPKIKEWIVTAEHVHRRERYFMLDGSRLVTDQDRDV